MNRTSVRRLVDLERRTIMCPRCEKEQTMGDFGVLGMNPLYTTVLVTIFRCKLCNHLFAPRLNGSGADGEQGE